MEDAHYIQTPIIVNAAGSWARNISLMAGADLPLRAMKHALVCTEGIPGMATFFVECLLGTFVFFGRLSLTHRFR